jgi:serine/threonine-protein phosphatase 2A regulatory subunit B'
MRPDLFIQKIKQCTVVFDFSDASAELREKEIKRQTLQEILEHISMNRGVLTENVYPEIVQMVTVTDFIRLIYINPHFFFFSLVSIFSVHFHHQ